MELVTNQWVLSLIFVTAMSEVTLHFPTGYSWTSFSFKPRRWFSLLGRRMAKWLVAKSERAVDRNLTMLAGYLEFTLLFSVDHATSEAKASKKPLRLMKKYIESELATYANAAGIRYPDVAFVAKLKMTLELIDKVQHRLELLQLLSLKATEVEQLPKETRDEILDLAMLRFRTFLANDPEEMKKYEEEASEWLEADFGPIID